MIASIMFLSNMSYCTSCAVLTVLIESHYNNYHYRGLCGSLLPINVSLRKLMVDADAASSIYGIRT